MRATHCKRNHPLAGVPIPPSGKRGCPACRKLRAAGQAPPLPQPYGPSADRVAYQRAWAAAHPDKIAVYAQRRTGVRA